MSSTSQKHREFVSEPMRGKGVTKLAGVGDVLGKRMAEKGYDSANSVLGQYLVMKGDKQQFQTWMKDTCQANSKQSGDTYKCLNDWSEQFL